MKYSIPALIILWLGGVIVWVILFLKMYEWTRQLLGIEECLWNSILLLAVIANRLRHREVWFGGVVMASSLLLAYAGYVTKHEQLHQVGRYAAFYALWVGIAIDATKPIWKKRLHSPIRKARFLFNRARRRCRENLGRSNPG